MKEVLNLLEKLQYDMVVGVANFPLCVMNWFNARAVTTRFAASARILLAIISNDNAVSASCDSLSLSRLDVVKSSAQPGTPLEFTERSSRLQSVFTWHQNELACQFR